MPGRKNLLKDGRADEIEELFRGVLRISVSKDLESCTRNSLGEAWSSLKHAELLLAFRKKFAVSFTYEEVVKIDSFATLQKVLNTK